MNRSSCWRWFPAPLGLAGLAPRRRPDPRGRLGRAAAAAEAGVRQLPGQRDRRPSGEAAGAEGQVGAARRSRAGARRTRSWTNCDVLIWWGHVRHGEIKPERAKEIVARIKDGKLSLIALHSAHWSTPFIEAMNERSRIDARGLVEARNCAGKDPHRGDASPTVRGPRSATDPLDAVRSKTDAGPTARSILPDAPQLLLPRLSCRRQAEPRPRARARSSDLAKGLPDEVRHPRGPRCMTSPFHVPPPDEAVFEETWDKGEIFRSGS